MFGSEGEKLQERRLQQAQKYAEQLKQQIALKNSQKPKTPALYSTTTSDSYINPAHQYSFQDESLNSSHMPQPIHSDPISNSDQKQKIIHDPLTDFKFTNVAPLNLTITSFQPDPIPSLPRQQKYFYAANTDKSTFNERIRSIESIFNQQRSTLIKSLETSSRISQSHLPMIQNSINDIKTRINWFLNSELSQKTNLISDVFQSNQELLNTENLKIRANIEDLQELSSEINTSHSQFTSKFNDSNESIKSNILEVKNNNSRLIDQTDLSLAKILQTENRESAICDNASMNAHDFESITDSASSSFLMLQQSTSEIMSTISSQIAQEIKVESNSRESLTNSLFSQASEINQNVSDNITRLQSLVNELISNFKSSIQSLNTSIGNSLNSIQDENDSSINDLDDQINTHIQSSEENFIYLQKESVSTIDALKNVVTQTRNVVEKALEDESTIREKNKTDFESKFDNLDLVVKREMSIQSHRMKEVGSQTIQKGTIAFDAMTQDSKTQLILIKQYSDILDKAESQLNEIEKTFYSSSSQITESLRRLTANCNELTQKFEKTRNSIENIFQEFEGALGSQEQQKPILFSRRDELNQFEQTINNACEKKISDIESQISLALSYLAEISVQKTGENNEKRPGSGIERIRTLANEARNYSSSMTQNETVDSENQNDEDIAKMINDDDDKMGNINTDDQNSDNDNKNENKDKSEDSDNEDKGNNNNANNNNDNKKSDSNGDNKSKKDENISDLSDNDNDTNDGTNKIDTDELFSQSSLS